MVFVSGKVTILPSALDSAASFAPFGSAANTRIAGLIALAANATPDIKPPPIFFHLKNKKNNDLKNEKQKWRIDNTRS